MRCGLKDYMSRCSKSLTLLAWQHRCSRMEQACPRCAAAAAAIMLQQIVFVEHDGF
jgi:hypothetical protein